MVVFGPFDDDPFHMEINIGIWIWTVLDYLLSVLNIMSTVEQDKQRSELLKKQLVQMTEDFDFMKKNRD